MKKKSIFAGTLAGFALLSTAAIAHDVIHNDHVGEHKAGDGHIAVRHDGHIDHLHDGHLHHSHNGHVDEHVLPVSTQNPKGEAVLTGAKEHQHSANDGHVLVQHGDHFDHLHDGHLHYMHGDHTDEHGALDLVKE